MNSYDSGFSMHLSWPFGCLCCLVVIAAIAAGIYVAGKASQRRS